MRIPQDTDNLILRWQVLDGICVNFLNTDQMADIE